MKTFLATGPEEKLMDWQFRVMAWVELFDRRGQTVRCRLHGIDYMDLNHVDWDKPADPELIARQLADVIEYAKTDDITIQLLEGVAESETYPVLHLGTHGMIWPPAKKSRKRKVT